MHDKNKHKMPYTGFAFSTAYAGFIFVLYHAWYPAWNYSISNIIMQYNIQKIYHAPLNVIYTQVEFNSAR